VKAALAAGQAVPMVIGNRRSEIMPAAGGKGVKPDHHLEGLRSTMVDAIFVPGGAESIKTLTKSGRALHWLREAFGHLKAIGATGEGVDLVRMAIELPSVALNISSNHETVESYGVVTMHTVKPESLGETINIVKSGTTFLSTFAQGIAMHRCWDRELDGLNAMVAY
jgi:catalase